MKTVTENLIHQKNSIARLNNPLYKKVNILMVDDRPENLLALEAVLNSPDYHLVSANSGKEALKCMLMQDFAVILMDVQMPGLNGFETAKLIKAREKTKHIPIIFITAINQEMEHVHQGYAAGAIDYIFKPFQPETLKQKIAQFVKIHRNHQDNILQTNRERTDELKEVSKMLDRTTLNLRRTEALAKVIGETIVDTIITFDNQGFILSVNPAIKSMFGYDSEELIGKQVLKLFLKMKGEIVQGFSFSFLSVIKESIGKVIESVAWRKDKSYFHADLLIGEATVEDQQIFVGTIRDVSERKQIEEVKKQKFINLEHLVEERTKELRRANEKLQKEMEERFRLDRLNLIGEMAAGIAHEIRNPMTTVQGFLQLSRNKDNPLSVEIIDLMLDELNRANTIITEFLNLAKNKVSVKKKQNLNAILNALSPLIQAEALRARKHVKLDLNKCPDIFLDQKEIRQLILNIALNGLDAMSPNGKLTIRTYAEEQAVILEIQDQGKGISPEVLQKLGTPFFTTKENGTGLGLAICYSVAKRHHAEIVINTGDTGTIFSIRFHI